MASDAFELEVILQVKALSRSRRCVSKIGGRGLDFLTVYEGLEANIGYPLSGGEQWCWRIANAKLRQVAQQRRNPSRPEEILFYPKSSGG